MQETSTPENQDLIREVQAQAESYLPQPLSQEVVHSLATTPRLAFGGTWDNRPCPIGCGQTISQPFMVAMMTELVVQHSPKREKVCEVGGGSGYQAAILSLFFTTVVSIERHKALAEQARKTLAALHTAGVTIKHGNGGRVQEKDCDAIIVTCGVVGEIPQSWVDSLTEQGILLMPYAASEEDQMELVCMRKTHDSCQKITVLKQPLGCRFVPFIDQEDQDA